MKPSVGYAVQALAMLLALPLAAAAHPVDQARKLPPTKAAPQLKEAEQAQKAARQRLMQEGRYTCCIQGGCAMCTQDGASCPCARLLAQGHGVCGECWESWQAGKGALGGIDPKTVKMRPRPASEEEYQRSLGPTRSGELLQKDRAALDNAKRTMVTEGRYSCCVRPGCDSCARAGACPCGTNLLAGKGVCGECLDGWHSGHGAFAGVDPKEARLEAMEMTGAEGSHQGMKADHGAGMDHMDSSIPGSGSHGSGTSWQPDASPTWGIMPRMRRRAMPGGAGERGPGRSNGGRESHASARPPHLVALLAEEMALAQQHTHPPFPEAQPQVIPPARPGAPAPPETTGPMGSGAMGMVHAWQWMYMGNAFVDTVIQSGPRGAAKPISLNWAMAMGHRVLGRGELMARLMMSLEPATVRQHGYPELFQTGEGLVDRQHAHDLFMEIAGQYARPINDRLAWTLYLGAVGEPALGPPAYPHRVSAAENPQTPLEHHLQDSTHISFGVLTGGIQSKRWRLEGSWFNAHEPDNNNRWDIDRITLNSPSVRLSYNPGPHWAMQVSRGWLNRPEAEEPGDIVRTTVSTIYSSSAPHGSYSAAFIWGRNEKELAPGSPPGPRTLDGILLEGVYNWADKNYLFGRIERLDRDELFTAGPLADQAFKINAFNVGYARDIGRTRYLVVALGGSVTFFAFPGELQPFYGDFPVGGHLFLRFRPRRAAMAADHRSAGSASMVASGQFR
jgi:hypothetical protein